MVNGELYRCIAKVVQQSVDEKNLNDWILTLSGNELITGRQLKELRKQMKLIKLEELLMNCCEIINDSEKKLELLTEAFEDEDCPVKGISSDIILKLFETGEVSESLIWMVDNWNELRTSVPLREKASRICSGISQDNWPLDFIYHMLTTENSDALEQFILNVKKKSQSMENEAGSTVATESENMDVEPTTDDLMPSNFESPSFPQNSSFSHLEYDENVERQEREQNLLSPQKMSRDSSNPDQPTVPMTADEIRRKVEAFEVCSPTADRAMDTEIIEGNSETLDSKKDFDGNDDSETIETGKEIRRNEAPTDSDADLPDNHQDSNAELPDDPIEAAVVTHSFQNDSQNKQDPASNEEVNHPQNLKHPSLSTDLEMGTAQGQPSTEDIQVPHPEIQVHITSAHDADARSRDECEGMEPRKNDADENTGAAEDEIDRHGSPFSGDTTATKSIQQSEIKSQKDEPATSTRQKTYASAVSLNIEPSQMKEKTSTKVGPQIVEMDSDTKRTPHQKTDEEFLKQSYDSHHFSDESDAQKNRGKQQQGSSDKKTEEELTQKEPRETTKGSLDAQNLEDNTVKQEDDLHRVHRSSSETSSASDDETGIAWYMKSVEEIEKYKFSLSFIARLAWPEEKNITEDWPMELINIIAEHNDEDSNLVINMTSLCKQIVTTTKPLTEECLRTVKDYTIWCANNWKLLRASNDVVVLLYRITWPKERIPESEIKKSLLSKFKTDEVRVNAVCDALKIVLENRTETFSETSCGSDEETDIAWYIRSVDEIEKHKFSLSFIARLAWPEEQKITEDWPIELINIIADNNEGESSLVKNFTSLCKQTVTTTKPLTKECFRTEKDYTKWFANNWKLLRASNDVVILLYRIAWPKDRIQESEIKKSLMSKFKADKVRVNAVYCALKIVLENRMETFSGEKYHKSPQSPSKKESESVNQAEEISGKPKGKFETRITSMTKHLKERFGLGRNKVSEEQDYNDSTKEVGESKKKKMPVETEREIAVKSENKESSRTSDIDKNRNKSDEAKPPTEKPTEEEEFHDANDTFVDSPKIANKPPTSDKSFEIRVVCVDTNPNEITMYIAENLWSDWDVMPMKYHSHRNYYYLVLPRPEEEVEFKYKYRIKDSKDRWYKAWLPENDDAYHSIIINKNTVCIHDVTLFHSHRAKTTFDIIKRDFGFHFPNIKKLMESSTASTTTEENYSELSLKQEVQSCVYQMKRGWKTAHDTFTFISQDMDVILVKWLEASLCEATEPVNLLSVVLHLSVALNKIKHNIFEANLLSILFSSLNMRYFNERWQKSLYQQIKAECVSEDNGTLYTICEALVGLYQQLGVLENTCHMHWMLSIPLYWLITNDGEVKKRMDESKRNATKMYKRSALPEADNLSWSRLRTKFKSRQCQQGLKSMADDILQVCYTQSWIASTYAYFLSEKSLVEMIQDQENYKVVEYFDIDYTFSMVMRGWKGSTTIKSEAFTDALLVEEFFYQRLVNLRQLDKTRLPSDERQRQIVCAKDVMELLRNITDDMQTCETLCGERNRNTVFVARMANSVAEWMYNLLNDGESYAETRGEVSVILGMLHGRISKTKPLDEDDMQFINSLLKIKWSNVETGSVWIERITSATTSQLEKQWPDEATFLNFYTSRVENQSLSEILEQCFERYAFKCTEKLLQNYEDFSWYDRLTDWNRKQRYVKLFEKLFEMEFDRIFLSPMLSGRKDSIKSLQFVTKWSFATRFWEIYCQVISKSMQNEKSHNKAKTVERGFRDALTLFNVGKMKISDSEFFVKHEKPIKEFYCVLNKMDDDSDSTDVDAKFFPTFNARRQQLTAIAATKRILNIFIALCSRLADTKDLEDMPLMQDGMICDVLEPKIVPINYKRGLQKLPNMTTEQMKSIFTIAAASESEYFQSNWKQTIDEQHENLSESNREITYTWQDVLAEIWPTVKEKIYTLIEAISDGSISVASIADVFQHTNGEQTMIDAEMRKLAGIGDLLGFEQIEGALMRQCEPIHNVLLLQKCKKSAALVLELKNVLELETDFHVIGDIQSGNDETLTLKEVNTYASEILSDELWTNSKFTRVLEEFIPQKKLISWLKKEMRDRREVKAFCDLGMISAGETSYDVDLVSFLLSAVNGYAPLIFDLPKDADMNNLLNCCKAVWRNAESDERLVEKWCEIGRKLDWFKGIREAHGSDGAHSLTMAQDINRHGVYFITKWENSALTIEDCLRLERENGNDQTAKVLTYSDLKDLQSKLMLIAGDAQGQEDVARFNDVLSAVANFAQRYINLINEGCMLFNGLKAIVQCSTKDLVISLTFTKDIQPISTTSSLADLEALVGVLDIALSQWTSYIEQMRLKHYYLNDYNMQQIMYLCEKLARSDFTDQVYSLLSNLKKKQVCQHLQDALDEATEVDEDKITNDEDLPTHEHNNPTETERKNAMVRKLARSDLNETLAKAAVQHSENKDLEDCEMWALENQHDKTLITQLAEKFDEEAGFGPDTSRARNYVSLLHNRTSVSLAELIAEIQTNEHSSDEELSLYGAVETICLSYNEKTSKLTLHDFLSIDHLGKFLGILRSKLAPIKGKIERKDFPGLKRGEPSLILLPPQDILYTTLALYLHNEEQPLPSKSEVLVCTEDTTDDEVGRFLRRAMLENPHGEKRLFCMTFVEKLMFTVSTHVETLFKTLSRGAVDAEYQMVILCSSNSQQHYLVTCFDRSRIDRKITFDKEELSNYIHSKLAPDLHSLDLGHQASVKLVKSKRSGLGKSLYVKRLVEKVNNVDAHVTIIRLLSDTIHVDHILKRLHREDNIMNEDMHLVHFDLTSAVQNGIEEFAFNLFVLGSLQDSQGRVWHQYSQHLYVIEMTESKLLTTNSVLNLIPCTECISPEQVLKSDGRQRPIENIVLMDRKEFESETFQRPFQYLKRYEANDDLDQFTYTEPDGSTEEECIHVLLNYCGMKNPSWSQLFYFTSFLNMQLVNCEESVFCQKIKRSIKKQDAVEFPGLKNFAVHFMIKMAQDIATPSLKVSDESAGKQDAEFELEHYQVRRKWEDETHPFVFFNEDRITMTFLNVNITSNGDLLDAEGRISKRNIVSRQLLNDLKLQGVPIGVDFNKLSRKEKLAILCQFMNIPLEFDPDPTYELTTDNVLKMFAIYVRLRSNIPVIIMGETGCGKTRMIEFMSKLKSGRNTDAKSMVTLKVHGGLKAMDIYDSVKEAKDIAAENKKKYNLSTVLFYDEANTTVAIHAIKEVVCDLTIDGEDFKDSKLQIVAACNPYKELSEAAVKKLEESGLGYNTKASEAEQSGHIPMRRLVYRVVALPPSMQPFVWDFGQLGNDAEEIYIKQMTMHLEEEERIGLSQDDVNLLAFVLCHVQLYMRSKCNDESRYVSLRDVERSLKTYEWFHKHAKYIFAEIIEYHKKKERKSHQRLSKLPSAHRCMLHTLSVCYHASLDDRESFRRELSKILRKKGIFLSQSEINHEIIACQTVFALPLKMDDNIARNEALRENVFLMTVCIDLRIPLFIVGKPGSSKSLAKTIVAENMQGKSSHCALYKHFKEVHMLSYQCSALTDAQGIESIFKQCSQLQSNQDINSYVAVVVLDEVGLAEDSPNMPLKVLHPLLECGSTKNGTLSNSDTKKKVAFIGISNWALDPAKMNRGIFVSRNNPDDNDLQITAESIFEKQNAIYEYSKDIKALTKSYLEIYKMAGQSKGGRKQYFGLRDYYSLIKMLHAKFKENRGISETDVYDAVQRNFSGGRETQKNLNIFHKNLSKLVTDRYKDPPRPLTLKRMVSSNLQDDNSRFLLLLANQYSSFNLLQSFILDFNEKVEVIFGSSFPKDHSYTQMCRNINRVKVCMEAGRTVVLLNLTEINESLYDALNQHYVTLGGQRYVDLGLGGHRVKSRIAEGFRLIVIELKEKVFAEYPIPLINRLEKHHLNCNSLLSEEEMKIMNKLTDWVKKFACVKKFQESDAFLGHNEDSVSSVVSSYDAPLHVQKNIILQSATADAVFRLPQSDLGQEGNDLLQVYVKEQFHDNLQSLLKSKLATKKMITLMEITTFSNILSDEDRTDLESSLGTEESSCHVMLLSLQQFQTEQDYLKKLDEFFSFCTRLSDKESAILLVQCSQAHKHIQLVACARYGLKNRFCKMFKGSSQIIIALLLSTERKLKCDIGSKEEKGLSLQHANDCEIIYIDELHSSQRSCGQMRYLHGKSICELLKQGRISMHFVPEVENSSINIRLLLQECVLGALAIVKNDGNEKRHLDRIKIVSEIFSEENKTSNDFLYTLLTKMVEIYQERENNEANKKNWITQEACSVEKLQQGGPFANILWLRLKEHVSHLLAFIISTIDRDNNLDILYRSDEKSKMMHKMWLQMFKACKMTWEKMRDCKEFVIKQSHRTSEGEQTRHLKKTVQIKIPFCYLLVEAFSEQWNFVANVPTEHELANREIFFKSFKKSYGAMDRAIGDVLHLPEPLVLLKALARELLTATFEIAASAAETLSCALEIISRRYKPHTAREYHLDSLPFLLIFYVLKKYMRHLEVITDVVNLCPEAEVDLKEWIKEIEVTDSVVLHQQAVEYALQKGKDKALGITDAESCIEWMNFMIRLKTIYNCSMPLLETTEKKDQVSKSLKPLAILDTLLLHLLPSPSSQDQFKKYLEVISSHAKLLFKGALKHILNNTQQQLLRIVCSVLRKYFEDLQLRIILSWQKKTCRICNKDCTLPTILKCGHYFCSSCLRNTFEKSQEKKNCFLCGAVLDDNFDPTPTALNDAQKAEVDTFQANCTSFFLEYLSHFAFVDNVDGSEAPEIIELIFDELIVNDNMQKDELQKIGLNLNQGTKANIFSVLMRYNSKKTEDVFNQKLQEEKCTDDVIFVALKHFDSALQQKNSFRKNAEHLGECHRLLKQFAEMAKSPHLELSLKVIKYVAYAHYAIRHFVKIIPARTSSDENDDDDDGGWANWDTHMFNIKRLMASKKFEELKFFFIKAGCRAFGMDWFSQIMQKDAFEKLIPNSLRQSNQNTIDYFTSLGTIYCDMRADLNKASAERNDKVKEWFPEDQHVCLNKLLALTNWLSNHQQSKDVFASQLSSNTKTGIELFDTMLSVVTNVWPLLEKSAILSKQQKSSLEQLILITVGSIKLQTAMVGELQVLMDDPVKAAKMFWPAMPESFYFSIPQEVRYESGYDAMYRCPNGHFYTIGNCTRPVTMSRCPDCHAGIGGVNYRSHSGNERVAPLQESTQAGYMLQSKEKNMQQPQERISMQATSLLQFIVHVCMLVGFQNKPNAAAKMLQHAPYPNVSEYLLAQMQKNIHDFADSVGRNLDEVLPIIIRIMMQISETQVTDESVSHANWNSLNSRNDWEKHFRTTFFLPVFQNLESTITAAQENLNAAENMTDLALFRLVHEVKEEKNSDSNLQNCWKNQCMWYFIEHPNSAHLIQCIRDHPRFQTGSVLHTILETPNIDLLQYLEDALKLQKMAIERYQNKIDLNDAEKTSLREFQKGSVDAQEMTRKYIKMWNKARIQAQSSHPNNETAGWFNEELTLASPISAILPSSRGRGRCAKVIIRYVLEIQNRFLAKCFKIIGLNESDNEIDIPLLLPTHLVKVDKKKDLLPLIYLHTSHVVQEDEYGRHHTVSYNVDALEKQARKNFVENKKIARVESLPCIKYTQDVGIGSDWKNVITTTGEQEALSARFMQTLDGLVLQATPADICEGVRTMTHAISFLAKVRTEPKNYLHEYLENDLLLPKNRITMIPKSAKIHHTLALYQHLSWHKAVNFVRQGLKPYKGALDQEHQEEIQDDEVRQKIEVAFQHMNVVLFQQRINEMIIQIPDYNKEWSLREDILPYAEFIGDDGSDDSWFIRIPEEVCFKHVAHIFELAVHHVQDTA